MKRSLLNNSASRNLATRAALPRAVIVLGAVSFFTDLSSEMIYPLLPVFLSTVLGAGALALGLIEGMAESTAGALKLVSGLRTDRMRRRKPFILTGYGLAGLVRPAIGLAAGWPFVMAMRFLDRVGKGLRTSPRDALIADVTDERQRGTAFGFHRALDHAGAVVGPLAAAALLTWAGMSLRQVFLLAAVPAAVVIIVIVLALHEPPCDESPRSRPDRGGQWGTEGSDFRRLLLAVALFTLGNSTDAFLLLRLSEAGVSAALVATLWSLHHVVKMMATYAGGRLSDRLGHRRLIMAGWLVYAAVYMAFATIQTPGWLVGAFLAYGLYFGLTEPAEKAWISLLVPEDRRGTAFGYYHAVVGLGALPASLLFGLIWRTWNASAAFWFGALLATASTTLLLLVRPRASRS